jgi:DNA mismatch repair protein MutS2
VRAHNRKILLGTVHGDKMQKTITVDVERKYRHRKYGKFLVKTRRFAVHDERNEAHAGDRVEITHLGLKGDVLGVDGETVTVQAGAVTVKVPMQALRVVSRGHSQPSPRWGEGELYPRPRRGRGKGEGARGEGAGGEGARGEGARISVPGKSAVAVELNIIGRTTDEARDLLEKYLDDAFLAGLTSVRIIHGKGTGALRRAVEEVLSAHPLVAEHRPGASSEGGGGATVATLSQG